MTLVEKEQQLGGQFALAWKAPGKEPMRESLESLVRATEESQISILVGRRVDTGFVKETNPDLLVWATGASYLLDLSVKPSESVGGSSAVRAGDYQLFRLSAVLP